MRWTSKGRQARKAAKAEAADERAATEATAAAAVTVIPHRNAYILIGLGGAVLTAFGIAGIAGMFGSTFFALVLTICAHPLRVALEKRGVPRGLATGAVITAVFLLLLAFGFALLFAFSQFIDLIPEFKGELTTVGQNFANWLSTFGINADEIHDISSSLDPSTVVGFVGGLVGGLTGWITIGVILFTMILLMAMDAGLMPTVLRQLYPVRPLTAVSLVTYGTNVRRYMVVTTILGLAQGFVNFIALVLLQVPGAFIWGLLAFICSFIPNIGYFLAIIPPIVFGGLVGGWPTVIAVIVVYGVINAVIQSVIQPRVVGRAVNLSQSITFFSVLFWAVVVGPIGAILAIPLSLGVRLILVDTNPQMNWIRPMIGDTDETRKLMAQFDAQAKADRKAKRAAARAASTPEAAARAASNPEAPPSAASTPEAPPS